MGVFYPQSFDVLAACDLVDIGEGYTVARTLDRRFVSVQPNGDIQYREAVGAWEKATRVGPCLLRYDGAGRTRYVFVQEMPAVPVPPPSPPAPGPPAVLVWDVSADLNFQIAPPDDRDAFIQRWTLNAYGFVKEGIVTYWRQEWDGLLARGAELGMVPPARYLLERIIGRGSGGDDIAKHGPYAGLSEDQSSRTPWSEVVNN
jgi:hypothetical protein